MRHALLYAFVGLLYFVRGGSAAEPAGAAPKIADDVRFQPMKDLNGYFPFTPPASLDDWKQRSAVVRRQTLVSQGLWPLPTKTPLNAVVHGKVEREGDAARRAAGVLKPCPHFVVAVDQR